MKKTFAAAAAVLACGLSGCHSLHSVMHGGESGGEWQALFDGKTLDNWNRVGDANWRLEDGLAVADKGNGFLMTKTTYTDFEIRAQFWVDEYANSGIYVRCGDLTNVNATTCYEMNVFDLRPDPLYGTGAITDLVKVSPMPKAGGKWNTYEIHVKGDHLVVKLNGVQTADVHDGKHKTGYVGLQNAPGAVKDKGIVKFRKVEIRPL